MIHFTQEGKIQFSDKGLALVYEAIGSAIDYHDNGNNCKDWKQLHERLGQTEVIREHLERKQAAWDERCKRLGIKEGK